MSGEKNVGKRWGIVAALSVGFTAGIFAGMSESPVGTALIAGIFGLIGGGGIWGVLKAAQHPPAPAKTEETTPTSVSIDWENIRIACLGTTLLCVGMLAGAVAGIGLREGWLLPQSAARVGAAQDGGALLDIFSEGATLRRSQQLKLVVFQAELKRAGVGTKENNQFVRGFIKAASQLQEPKSVPERELAQLRLQSKNVQQALSQALDALSAQAPDPPDNVDESKIPRAPPALKSPADIRYQDVERAFFALDKGLPIAVSVEETLKASATPELELLIDLLASYRQADTYVPDLRQARSPLAPIGKKWRDDRRSLSIKP